MISGTASVPNISNKESICRSSRDYYFSEIGDYKIHSTTLMPNIPFEEDKVWPEPIDKSLFINDEETKPEFESQIKCQNFMTVKYVGRAPLEYYGPMTKMGREFILVCRDYEPRYQQMVFGTESSIHSYNREANDNFYYPNDDRDEDNAKRGNGK